MRICFYIDRYVANDDILFAPSTNKWINEDVTVTVSFGENLTPTSLTCTGEEGIDYTINGTTSVIVKTNNQTITAIGTDTEGKTITKTFTISNIDKIVPTVSISPNGGIYTIQSDESKETIETTITASDTGGSEIKDIKYTWSTSNTEKPYFSSGLENKRSKCNGKL